jgi:hypothetical protein
VTGFTAGDVDLSGSTVGGSLVAAVSGSGSDYTVSVTGMSGVGTVTATVPAGAAIDDAGNPNAASTSTDNSVLFDHAGVFNFGAGSYSVTEADGSLVVTVTRTAGTANAVTVDYATSDGTATAGSDYAAASGTLSWANGDTSAKTFTIPITNDTLSEGKESIHLTLSNPTGLAVIGPTGTAVVTIAPSDGKSFTAGTKAPKPTFTDADGDKVTLTLGGKTGTLTYYMTNDGGAISEIDLTGTDPLHTTVTVAVKKGKAGDGKIAIGEVDGTGFKSFTAKGSDLIGTGFALTGFAGSITVADVKNGADFELGGAAPTAKLGTKVTAGVIADGTDIHATAPLAGLTAIAVGKGTIEAPSVGTITVKGQKATKTKPFVAGDFQSDLTIAGTGQASGKVPALKGLTVAGAVAGSTIAVGGAAGTSGDVGGVKVGSFVDSELLAGYAGPADGSGTFNLPSTVKSFVVTGKADGFANSFVLASTFNSVTLASVKTDNGGTAFGFRADTAVKKLAVTTLKFKYDPKGPATQATGDFDVRVV